MEVAIKYGYESTDSFSRAFQKIHGIKPLEAHNEGVQLKHFQEFLFKFR
jgi:AraC family transcriptional regulator